MNIVFIIEGGPECTLCSIPALKKFIKNNPLDSVKICTKYDNLFWGLNEFDGKVFNIEHKGVFDNVFVYADKVVTANPYRVPRYYRQDKHLLETFDIIINETHNHSDLDRAKLAISKEEELRAVQTIKSIRFKEGDSNLRFTLAIEPWSFCSAFRSGDYIIDSTSKSFETEFYLKFIRVLSEKYNVILLSDTSLQLEADVYTEKSLDNDLRTWASIIDSVDYFVGCDSIGQHIAYGLNKPGTIILGSTFADNVSYKRHFKIYENAGFKKYAPVTISEVEVKSSNIANDNRMTFSDEQISEIVRMIDDDIERNYKRDGNMPSSFY
jgi:hypothetical protein